MNKELPWNFVIQYRGREGSSAIINTLSHQEGVRVPVFEELDFYIYKKHHKYFELTNVLNGVFSQGLYLQCLRKPNSIAPVDVSEQFQSIGFKWRLFGNRIQLAKMFKRNRVKLFILTRRDFAELVGSAYYHNVGIKAISDADIGPFPQFSVMSEKGTDGEILRRNLSNTIVPLKRFALFKCALKSIKYKWSQANSCLIFKLFSVPVKQIYYEDFLNNPEAFISDFMNEIKIESNTPTSTTTNFNRVYSNKHQDRIDGSSRGFDTIWFKASRKIYDFLIWRVDHM